MVNFPNYYSSCISIITAVLVLTFLFDYGASYTIPEPRFEILKPKGFRVIIPDEVGISRVTLTTNLMTPGKFNPQNRNDIILKSSPKRWIYENKIVTLISNQTFQYSIFVRHDKAWHELLNQVYVVPCGLTSTTIGGQKVCQGQLIFEDNFNNFNTDRWRREVRIPLDDEDADFVVFANREENLLVENGTIIIQPKRIDEIPGYDVGKVRHGELNLGSECTANIDLSRECVTRAALAKILPPLFSASIDTKQSFSFRYGKIEVRAKLPIGDWLFPLITLEPLARDYGVSAYASGQMRVAYIRGNAVLKRKDGTAADGSYLYGGVVLERGANARDNWLGKVHGSKHWGDEFHTYSLTWRETSISLACDGRVYASICTKFNRHLKSQTAPFDKEFYVRLALSAGGVSDFPDESISNDYRKPWANDNHKNQLHFWTERDKWYRTWNSSSSRLTVDYVKVWAL